MINLDVVIGFEEEMYSGSESSGMIQVVVAILQGELSEDVAVRIFTEDASALSTSDYTSVNRTLTFSSTSTRITISVPILDDNIDENDEIFLANLELDQVNSVLFALIQPDKATLRILDDDGTHCIANSSCLLFVSVYVSITKVQVLFQFYYYSDSCPSEHTITPFKEITTSIQ